MLAQEENVTKKTRGTSLHISDDFALPIDAATETFGILAKRGKGKTYTGAVLAEEFLEHGIQTIVLDPMDVWWGLRAGADGAPTGGYPIVLVGGKFGDFELDPTKGEEWARIATETDHSFVFVTHQHSKSDHRKFVTDFNEEFYQRAAKNPKPRHLILEEVDKVAPKRLQHGDERMFASVDDNVRRGRSSGTGVTMISQRPAVVHNDILSQVEVLVAMGMTLKHDIKAIDGWVDEHGDKERRDELVRDLPSLAKGDAYIWSPDFLDIFKRVHFRKRRTFDSSVTPKVGQPVHVPKALLKLDSDKLSVEFAAAIEQVKKDDPEELKKQIRELQKQVASPAARSRGAAAPAPASTRTRMSNAPATKKEIHAAVVDATKPLLDKLQVIAKDRGHKRALAQLERARERAREVAPLLAPRPAPARSAASTTSRPSTTRTTPTSSPRARAAPAAPTEGLSSKQQAMLDSLAELETLGWSEVSRPMLAGFVGLSHNTGHFRAQLGGIISAGMAEIPRAGLVRLTGEGRAKANPRDAPQTAEDLHARLKEDLTGPQRDMIDVAISVYPEGISRVDLAAKVNLEANTGHFRAQVGRMVTLGIFRKDGPGRVKLDSWVMLEKETG